VGGGHEKERRKSWGDVQNEKNKTGVVQGRAKKGVGWAAVVVCCGLKGMSTIQGERPQSATGTGLGGRGLLPKGKEGADGNSSTKQEAPEGNGPVQDQPQFS